MKKWILLFLVVAGIVAAVVARQSGSGRAEASSTLITAAVSRGDVVQTVQATGTLEAVTTVQVGTQVSGTIKALHADFNSMVRQGQVVAELEPSLFQAQVEQARATLVRLQAERERAQVQVEDGAQKLKRARELSARQLLPASELETAESAARQAEAALRSADAQIVQSKASLNQNEVNLGHTIIRAPIDGIVVSRNVDVGQTVAASMQAPTLFVIARDLTQMQVSASIDESDIGRIVPGQVVRFRVDAYPDDVFQGTVRQVRLQPVVTQNVVSYTTIIAVPNPSMKLKPGMTATVTVEIARATDVLRVPAAALRFRPTQELFESLGQTPPPNGGTGREPGAPMPNRQSRGTEWADGRGAGIRLVAMQEEQGMRRRFQNLTPEQREQMRQRFQSMTPEERERLRQERGQRREQAEGVSPEAAPSQPQPSVGADARGREARGQARESGGRTPRGAAGARAATAATDRRGTPQADATPRPIMRPVWRLTDGKIERVIAQIGISDGALAAVLGGPLREGDVVVTGVAQPPATTQGGGNPLMPFGGRFPGGGGNRPGGGGFGGAGGAGGGGRPPGGGTIR